MTAPLLKVNFKHGEESIMGSFGITKAQAAELSMRILESQKKKHGEDGSDDITVLIEALLNECDDPALLAYMLFDFGRFIERKRNEERATAVKHMLGMLGGEHDCGQCDKADTCVLPQAAEFRSKRDAQKQEKKEPASEEPKPRNKRTSVKNDIG